MPTQVFAISRAPAAEPVTARQIKGLFYVNRPDSEWTVMDITKQAEDVQSQLTAQAAEIAKLREWIQETAVELGCRCIPAYKDRGLHGPDCMEYLLADCPVPLKAQQEDR